MDDDVERAFASFHADATVEPGPEHGFNRLDQFSLTPSGLELTLSQLPNYRSALDGTFGALADPTRRAIVARLVQGPATVSELAEPFDMAMPSLMQHLKKLESAGLVSSRKKGRVRTCWAELAPLQDATKWLTSQQALWERRLDQLEAFLDENP